MFYDYELGEASYTTPSGEITGEVSLKRQYRIRKGEMEFMIESSITVHDEILQEALSSHADDRMRNIVATIQREQNRIIRNEEASTLIIQGVAGSGKTSIALHRIAYLLYSYNGEIRSKDILILSPNKVFADYISNVLPELGEETVPETSMEEILSGVLDHKYKYQTIFQQVKELLGKPQPGFIDRIRYKASTDFITQLDAFIIHIENRWFTPADVRLTNGFIIPGEFIEEQFRRFDRYPMRQRFDVMADYILDLTQVQYRIPVTTDNRNLLRREIRNMFGALNDLEVYKAFFDWVGKPDMFQLRKNRSLENADLAPLAYLRLALDGNQPNSRVKHLLIDEMQDYTPIQYKVIQKLFSCRKTILGDAGQSVNPYGSSTAEMIREAFVTGEIMRLNKSYRSTTEITAFARTIRPDTEAEVMERHGEPPRIYRCKGTADEYTRIAALIGEFRESPHKSLGIICKDETQAQALYERFREEYEDLFFLSYLSTAYVNGIIVTSAHMAKGLEFDEVIVPHAGRKNYQTEIDRSMLYVAVTRAMHKLSLTTTGEITELIGTIAPETRGL
jgi:DNA helicase-2/ATP-dependent DNA helicase PcrA